MVVGEVQVNATASTLTLPLLMLQMLQQLPQPDNCKTGVVDNTASLVDNLEQAKRRGIQLVEDLERLRMRILGYDHSTLGQEASQDLTMGEGEEDLQQRRREIHVLDLELRLERERSRGLELHARLEKAERQVAELEQALERGRERGEMLQLELNKVKESERRLEDDLRSEKDFGMELMREVKMFKGRVRALDTELKNCTTELTETRSETSNRSREILMLRAKLRHQRHLLKGERNNTDINGSPPELRERLQQTMQEVSSRKEHLRRFLEFLQAHRKDAGKWSTLLGAVEYAEPVVLQTLLDAGSEDVNALDNKGKTSPLLRAAELGRSDLVLLLVAAGAKITLEDSDGRTALHNAAKEGHTNVMSLLLDIGADVSVGNRWRSQPVHYAAWNGHLKATRLLLERGADVNAWSLGSWSPLHRAVQGGHLSVAHFLVTRGANLTTVNENGDTPKDMASSKGADFLNQMLNGLKSNSPETESTSERADPDTQR